MPNRRYGYFVPAILWAILIYSLSTTSSIPKIDFNLLEVDKLGHMTFYAILTLLLIWGFAKKQQWRRHHVVFIIIATTLASAYGISLEYVQAMLPHRSFDTADMLANEIGVLLGLIVYRFTAQRFFLLVD